MNPFNVGERAMVIWNARRNVPDEVLNKIGKVVAVKGHLIGIEFDFNFPHGHDMDGMGKNRQCCFFESPSLKPVEKILEFV